MQMITTNWHKKFHKDNNKIALKLLISSQLIVQLIFIIATLGCCNQAKSFQQTPAPPRNRLQAAASNHTVTFVADNSTSAGSASERNNDKATFYLRSAIKPPKYEFDDDDEAENDEIADGEEIDEDEEDFYHQNPVGSLEFTLDDIDEPAGLENETVDERPLAGFDDFDDFEALKLGDFFGDRQSSNTKKRPQQASAASRASVSKNVWNDERAAGPKAARYRIGKKPKFRFNKKKKKKKKTKSRNEQKQLRRQKHKHQTSATTTAHSSGPAAADQCAMALSSNACLTFGMVEWALGRARRLLTGQLRAADDGTWVRPPSEATINSIGELVELASRLLVLRFQLTSEEATSGLEQIDVRRTSLWRQCPRFYRAAALSSGAAQSFACPPLQSLAGRFRSHSGRCNSVLGAHLGASHMPFVRMLEPAYADLVGAPRGSFGALPPARLVSLEVHPAEPAEFGASDDQSALFANWGQLINHDLALAAGGRPASGHSGSCCQLKRRGAAYNYQLGLASSGSSPLERICLPIEVSRADPIYGQLGIQCHEFKRSLAALRPGCSLGARSQLNLVSSFVDASFVYGTSASESRSLRTARGQLATWNYFRRERLKPLLPAQVEAPDQECVGRAEGLYCFRSGDQRTNQHLPLVLLHTMHARQHNRLASALEIINNHWSNERIYHEARHIHIALVQHILLTEYLPLLLGEALLKQYQLVESDGYWDHYDASVNPGISPEFAAAAFRQGHSTVPSLVFRLSRGPAESRWRFGGVNAQASRVYPLRQLFRQPWPLFEPFALDQFLAGLLETPAKLVDQFVSAELAGHLLQEPGERVGLDLVAINVQRGRDQGLADYNSVRAWCGLERFYEFEQLKSVMSNWSSETLARLYASIDDIDLFSGGLSEFPLKGAQVGPTFACIIGRQFQALRAGDRLWFESSSGPHAFTRQQLASIKQVTLARLLCANSDRFERAPDELIQVFAMRLPHPVLNPSVPCNSLPDVDVLAWLEAPPAPQSEQTDDQAD